MSFALVVQPHDVLLFRDGKPFAAGTDTRARSLFPPTPFTIQGAIRARVLFSSGISPRDYVAGSAVGELRDKIGLASQSYGKLQLQGPFLARQETNGWTRYFPLPADVVKIKGKEELKLLEISNEMSIYSNLPLPELGVPWAASIDRPEEQRSWLAEKGLQAYLQGECPSAEYVCHDNHFVCRESRFGIALQAGKRTVREGFLYTADFVRLQEGVALWIEVDGIQPEDLGPKQGFLQLGGESRVAYYECLETKLLPKQELSKYFKLVLLTPAWFTNGWQPNDWQQFFDGPVRLVSAVIPRYQVLGGAYVDDQRRRTNFQKPMRRFVPAGSVYYFENKGGAVYRGQPVTETPAGEGDYGQIGFGCAVIGRWR